MQVIPMIKRFYGRTYGRWTMHILFWLFLVAARFYIQQITFNPFKAYPAGVLSSSLLATGNNAIAFYLLVYGIWPIWHRLRSYWMAGVSLLLLLIVFTGLESLSDILLLHDPRWASIIRSASPDYDQYLHRGMINVLLSRILSLGIVYQLFLGLALPLVIKIAIAYYRSEIQKVELRRQNLQLEFDFLRAQVNPHFLFNTLNNIYSLILHDQKQQSADMVAKLSAFMRYCLQDSDAEKVPVAKEIQLMRDYIELEKVRLNYTKVTSEFMTDDKPCQLPPLLLIPLLENAFKYCADSPNATIEVCLHLTKGRLTFRCANSVDPLRITHTSGGIGLTNLTRRLKEYYQENFTYTILRQEGRYSVELIINSL